MDDQPGVLESICDICGSVLKLYTCPKCVKPGSMMALHVGCTCPAIDNRGGFGFNDIGEFIIDSLCPIHGVDQK